MENNISLAVGPFNRAMGNRATSSRWRSVWVVSIDVSDDERKIIENSELEISDTDRMATRVAQGTADVKRHTRFLQVGQ